MQLVVHRVTLINVRGQWYGQQLRAVLGGVSGWVCLFIDGYVASGYTNQRQRSVVWPAAQGGFRRGCQGDVCLFNDALDTFLSTVMWHRVTLINVRGQWYGQQLRAVLGGVSGWVCLFNDALDTFLSTVMSEVSGMDSSNTNSSGRF